MTSKQALENIKVLLYCEHIYGLDNELLSIEKDLDLLYKIIDMYVEGKLVYVKKYGKKLK